MESFKITIELEHAKKQDFATLVRSKPKKEYVVRIGVPFWLFNSKGEIEPKNYITNESTTFFQLNQWFSNKQILTIKNR